MNFPQIEFAPEESAKVAIGKPALAFLRAGIVELVEGRFDDFGIDCPSGISIRCVKQGEQITVSVWKGINLLERYSSPEDFLLVYALRNAGN